MSCSARVSSHTHGRYLCLIVAEHGLVRSRTASFVPVGVPRYNCERFRVSTKRYSQWSCTCQQAESHAWKNRGNESATTDVGGRWRRVPLRFIEMRRAAYSRVFGNNTLDVDAFVYLTTKRRRRRRVSCWLPDRTRYALSSPSLPPCAKRKLRFSCGSRNLISFITTKYPLLFIGTLTISLC